MLTGNPRRREVHETLPPELHNCGYSSGLEYPFIFRDLDGQWLIWDRHTGVIVEIVVPDHPMRGFWWAGQRCRALNGIPPPTPAENALINALHDSEP
jgi:hypothetical protein